MDNKAAEKRKYIRFFADTKISFKTQEKKQASEKEILGALKNLSIEGICFMSDSKLEPGTIIKVEAVLPSRTNPLRLEGEVRWAQSKKEIDGKEMFEIGVKLFTIEKSDEAKFIGHIYDVMLQNLDKQIPL